MGHATALNSNITSFSEGGVGGGLKPELSEFYRYDKRIYLIKELRSNKISFLKYNIGNID